MELYNFQIKSVDFIKEHNGVALIAHEMGLGKTIIAIDYIRQMNIKKVLIVCPASIKYNWYYELLKWANVKANIMNAKEIIYNDDNESNRLSVITRSTTKPIIFIINYDILQKHRFFFIETSFELLILDESHRIKNKKAKRTKIIFELFRDIPKKIFLTGTPITSRPSEFFTQINLLSPDSNDNFFKYKTYFEKRYCGLKKNMYGYWEAKEADRIPELRNKITHFYYRCTKKKVLKDLPDKTRQIIPLYLSSARQKEYDKIKMGYLNNSKFGYFGASKHLVIFNALKMFLSKIKVKQTKDFIDNIIENEKIVIFTNYLDNVKELLRHFLIKHNIVAITGDTNIKKRQKYINDFNKDDKIKIIVITLAGKEGITLNAASKMLFLDLLWTPGEHLQLEDRIHRIGQNKPCIEYYMIYFNTIEEKIMQILNKKFKVLTELLDGEGLNDFYQLNKKSTDKNLTKKLYEMYQNEMKENKNKSIIEELYEMYSEEMKK